ncbi:MAG: YIP1 family protein [Clostridia bacterium]|nr:YIP1 family protein [Clostridia bacterium]
MKKAISAILMAVCLLMVFTTVASAAAPYQTYTYSSTGFVLTSPDAYVPDSVVDASTSGAPFADIQDIVVGPDGNIYIADAGNNCVYVLSKYYRLIKTIDSFVNEQGVPDSFAGPQGVFVTDKYVYICDTDNNRIVLFDLNYEFKKTVGKPESNLFTEGAIYKPVAVAVDSYDRMFIVSSTTYEGIIVMNDDGAFFGFVGAQKATVTAWQAVWNLISGDSKDEEMVTSTEYNNITVDKDNFLYVTTNSIDEASQQNAIMGKDKSGTYAPVKKLNASGTDVMTRNGFYPPSGEVKVSTSATSKIQGASSIVDAAVGPEGTWSIIDDKRSKVFTYDNQGNLLFAFGDSGSQLGSISTVTAVVYNGDDMILVDRDNASFTIFRRTEYGDTLIKALASQNAREYGAEVENWKDILKRNNNFDIAYIGIAQAMSRDGDHAQAMEYYKVAYDNGGYSNSFKEIRKEWISSYFLIIPVVVILVLWLVFWFMGFAAKKNRAVSLKVGQKNITEELLYAFHVIFHPFDGYWDLKHEKRGSIRSGFLILIVTILAFFYQTVGTGYIFAGNDVSTDSLVMTLASVVVPVMLWIIANWCLTTLFEGEGTFADVFTATCYALTPLPIIIFPATLISNVLVAEEGDLVTMAITIGFIWAGLLLFFGMMTTHGYSFSKNIVTVLGTIVGMIFIMFVAVLFTTLLSKMFTFVYGIVDEIQYRM